MIILGIDPGIRAPLGGVLFDVEQNAIIAQHYLTFARAPSGRLAHLWLQHRLRGASEFVGGLLDRYTTTGRLVLAVEQQILGRNVQSLTDTSILVGRLTQLADVRGLDWVLVKPAQAKQALTTRGNASKDQMVAMAHAHGVVFDREAKPSREAIADALGIALAATYLLHGRELEERVG
jgi:Holliday junction resolvasome RuvABC endonuclease subunit